MKLNKKFLACFMAATMAIAPMTAFGDSVSSQISGNGEVKHVESEFYNVILPTNESINFKVDPYGLLNITGTNTLENVISDAAGSVTSSATAIINKSSVDIKVKVSSYVSTSGATINLATTRAEAVSGTKDLYLAVTQVSGAAVSMDSVVVTAAAADITGDATLVGGEVYTVSGGGINISGGALAATGNAVTTTTSSAMSAFNIDLGDVAAAYDVTSTGAVTLSEGAVRYTDDNTYVFQITGFANPNSDVWADLAKPGAELKLNMKFEISTGATALTATGSPTTGATLTYNGDTPLDASYMKVNGVLVSNFQAYKNVKFNSDNTITVGTQVLSGSSEVRTAAVNGVYTIEVKDTSGKFYSVEIQ